MAAMKKPVIAVDIDDTLAANAKAFVAYSNQLWGTSLRVEDYDEHWQELWKVDLAETQRRADKMHDMGIFGRHEHFSDAKPVLQKLATNYSLAVVTSRRKTIEAETLAWIDRYYGGIFENVHFAGIWDSVTDQSIHLTKADILQDVGASYLVDDQLKHCKAAAEIGVKAILYGNYTWNQVDQLPEGVVRCNDWQAVGDYFDAIK